MTRSIKQWQRNTLGLRTNAQRKAEATEQRAEAAISQLLKERIMHLRAQQIPKAQVKIPPKEQASSASKDAMIAALRQRIQKLEMENRDLKQKVEVAYGLLHQQAGGKIQ